MTPLRTPIPPNAPTQELSGFVINELVNIRSGPGVNFEIVGNAYRDDQLFIYGTNSDGSWLQIDDAGDRWIWASLVNIGNSNSSITPSPILSPTPTPTIKPPATVSPGKIEVEVIYNLVNLRSGQGPLTELSGTSIMETEQK